jgi:hypothetical protein
MHERVAGSGWQADVQQWIAHSEKRQFAYTASVSFVLYFLVYFWKVGIYVIPNISGPTGEQAFGMDLDTAWAMASTIGFGLSKVPAMRQVSKTLDRDLRCTLMGCMISSCLIFNLGVAMLPNEGKVVAVLLASFPASWIYGVILRYLEGRLMTEPLAAFMSMSWICGGGACRSAAAWILANQSALGLPSAYYMPLLLGAFALPLALFCVVLLDLVPPPCERDIAARSVHRPMSGAEQWAFFKRFYPGVILLLLIYVIMTSYRNFRDSYLPSIFTEALGHELPAAYYFLVEIPGGVLSALLLSSTALISDNAKAMHWLHFLMGVGAALIGGATLLYQAGAIGPIAWYVPLSSGIYVAYSVMGIGIYDRLIALTGTSGTCVFLTFASDGLGYIGTIGILFFKQFGSGLGSYLDFFITSSLFASASILGMALVADVYFARTAKQAKPAEMEEVQFLPPTGSDSDGEELPSEYTAN